MRSLPIPIKPQKYRGNMKPSVIAALFMICLFNLSFASDNEVGHTYHSGYKGKTYKSAMLIKTLESSPDLDLSNPALPMPLTKIVDISYSQLIKLTGTKTGWNVTTIALHNWYDNNKKWFYSVSFSSDDCASMSYISVLITVDGKFGIIKEVTEQIIK